VFYFSLKLAFYQEEFQAEQKSIRILNQRYLCETSFICQAVYKIEANLLRTQDSVSTFMSDLQLSQAFYELLSLFLWRSCCDKISLLAFTNF
jgi:hypothetical protein